MGIAYLGDVALAESENISDVLIRNESSGETFRLTDPDSIESLLTDINSTICIYYPDDVEANDSKKEVLYIIDFNPSGDSISLSDNLLFVYSVSEFHAGKYHYKALSGGINQEILSLCS